MKTDELREKYLSFFQSKGHHRQASDVLVPTWDPSVLFTPAGMNQFKDHFLGKVKLEFTKATTCQKCLRTGDIDNVGRTAYHHTFFEMLGNFSFGDYFKSEAIHWAWEFLTDKKWLGIDPARLTVTVYKDDDEAAGIWHEKIGLPTSRISRLEEDENFWPASAPSQGPDGVCGPCSEIYFQLDNGKSVEIWNLVFTQFNRVGDPPNNLRPLPSKNIDTGMGLERTASVLQGQPSNFHIDILFPIVKAAAEVCNVKYEYDSDIGRRLRRITDHVRACTFAIHENVYPGPKKARYVIKRLLRRAVLDGHQLGMREPFMHQLVPIVAEMMRVPYPELGDTIERVSQVMKREEADFFNTIDAGLERIQRLFGDMSRSGSSIVDGREAANLYQTFGVPPELLQNLATDQSYTFDWDGYKAAMAEHEEISGAEQKELFQTGPVEQLKESVRRTDFLGYETTTAESTIKGIIVGPPKSDQLVTLLSSPSGETMVRVILDKTPFYGESGGQVGDIGKFEAQGVLFEVTDTQRAGELIIHYGKLVSGELKVGAVVRAEVDTANRDAIRRAHSATHILHHALQKILGSHAQQQGSKVEGDWLRFDFSNQEAVTEEQLREIETISNNYVSKSQEISWKTVPLAEARKAGAMMLFGEKYPDPVRMVSMGDFSRELCGGTHLTNTRQVESIEILGEESVSAGVRRVTALTGRKAALQRKKIEDVLQQACKLLGVGVDEIADVSAELATAVRKLKKLVSDGNGSELAPARIGGSSQKSGGRVESEYPVLRSTLRKVARIVNTSIDEVPTRMQAMLAEQEQLHQQLANLSEGSSITADDLLQQAELVDGVRLIVAETPKANVGLMRKLIDQLRKSSGSEPVAVLLGSSSDDGKVTLIAGLSSSLVEKKKSAGKWISPVAAVVGGGGGGKPDLAQAGGKDPSKLAEALSLAKKVWSEI
jgi:alanyl-tRNA synthetase